MRAVEESARMRSLVCCGVSRTACCARLDGAKTSTPSRAVEMKDHNKARSRAGCMRMDDPHVIIQGEGRNQSGISRIVMAAPTGGCGLAGLLDFRVGQVSHQEKQQCVRRDMQVEIDEAVDEKTRASHETRELQGSSERIIELPETLQRLDQ